MRNGLPRHPRQPRHVYSLTKTLLLLALPGRGPYAPDGTHRADSEGFSLWETGGGDKRTLDALRQVLEAATEFTDAVLLSMAHFRDELQAWLDRYPRGTLPPAWGLAQLPHLGSVSVGGTPGTVRAGPPR